MTSLPKPSYGWIRRVVDPTMRKTKVQAVMIPTLLVILSVRKMLGSPHDWRIVLDFVASPKEEATVCVRIQKSNSKLMRNWRIPILPGFQNELQTCFFSFWLGFLQNFHRFRSYPYDDANDPLVCLYIQAPAGSFWWQREGWPKTRRSQLPACSS